MKFWQYPLLVLLLMTLGLFGCGGQAAPETQPEEAAPAPQTETYTDENGFFTAEYPAGWMVEPYGFEDAPFPHVIFGSHQEIIDLSEVYEPLPENQIGVAVMLIPRDMFAEAGVTAETPLDEVARLVLGGMADAPEDVEELLAEATFEAVTLSNGVPAARITASVPTEAYVIHFADVGDGLYLFTPQILAVDYHNANLEAEVEAIINSVNVTASSEEVTGFIMGENERDGRNGRG